MRPNSCQLYCRMRVPGHVTSGEGLQRSVPGPWCPHKAPCDHGGCQPSLRQTLASGASRPGPASPADNNNDCYKPIKDLFKDFFEQLSVLFIIISRAKRIHSSWEYCTLEAVFALCSLLSASNRKSMAIKSTGLEFKVYIRQK